MRGINKEVGWGVGVVSKTKVSKGYSQFSLKVKNVKLPLENSCIRPCFSILSVALHPVITGFINL